MGLLSDKIVRDVMTKGVVTVDFTAPVKEVLELLIKNDITALVAVAPGGEAMGVVSSFDVIRMLQHKTKTREETENMTAEDLLTPFTEVVNPTWSLEDAARIMAEKRIHRLVVIQPHFGSLRPVGILSTTDIIRVLNRELHQEK